MSYEVLKVQKKDLAMLKKHYMSSLKEKTPQGAVFAAKTGHCNITAYQSGKVLFQGKGAPSEAAKWKGKEGVKTDKKKPVKKTGSARVDNHSYYPPDKIEEKIVLGSDETGTGDYFGPVTVVCVHLTEEQMSTIDSWGVRDSKTIKDETIRELAPRLLKECTYSLLVLNNEKYNRMQEQGMNQGQMKALLHHQAIENVMEKCKEKGLHYEGVLVDQFVSPDGYFKYLAAKKKAWISEKPIYFATKAEGLHPAVAAASILARYSFLQEMDKISQLLNTPVPKGAGPHVDKAAKQILLNKGKDTLYKVTKWHFSNTQRVL
ncbi:ribonuclease HIII [Salipaludibacillus aurantiacus]|uniref:Ribonuclease HIII n=1 Tax=Salipaludibacillus aurantiacus TaxID=1601833 RepID=A0A1H9SZL9_9BACI|nr:ribonuclease HIII [Salipaludibacillus aurantiacus]SER90480.1 ribonuclease HIII [Salipaludibacillus aurantiacus]